MYHIANRWVKECGADKNEALDGVKDVFGEYFNFKHSYYYITALVLIYYYKIVAYIDVYRKYKNLPPLKQNKVGVNESCPCKSGKKFKKCHFEYQQKYLQY